MGSYIAPKKRKMETLIPDAIVAGESADQIWKKAKTTVDEEGDAKMK